MNYASMVTDSISPSAQKASVSKNTEVSRSFSDVLAVVSEAEGAETKPESVKIDFLKEKLLLPDADTVGELSSGLDDALGKLFAEYGIPKDPPVEIDYNYGTNMVEVTGDRDDLDKISELINSDPAIKEQTRTLLAISSHFLALQDSIQFQTEYCASDNPEAVVNRYSYLFNDNRTYPKATYLFGSESGLLSDGALFERGTGVNAADTADASGEDDETKEIFDRIKHLLLLNYIRKDPEDEEEENSSSGGGASDDSVRTENDEAAAEYSRLMRRIEAAREDALSMYGDDKNKYALAVESFISAQHDEETEKAEDNENSGKDADGDKTTVMPEVTA